MRLHFNIIARIMGMKIIIIKTVWLLFSKTDHRNSVSICHAYAPSSSTSHCGPTSNCSSPKTESDAAMMCCWWSTFTVFSVHYKSFSSVRHSSTEIYVWQFILILWIYYSVLHLEYNHVRYGLFLEDPSQIQGDAAVTHIRSIDNILLFQSIHWKWFHLNDNVDKMG